MESRGEDLDLECKTPERPPRLVELACFLVIIVSAMQNKAWWMIMEGMEMKRR